MGQGRKGQGHVGRASAWALLGAAALLVGTVMTATAAFAADEPTTTLGSEAPPTTVAPDPPVQTGDPVAPPAADPPVGAAAATMFSKSFSPTPIAPGGTSQLTYSITATGVTTGLAFTDNLPNGVTVKTAATASQCGGTVTAAVGSTTVKLVGGAATDATCTIVVDVTSLTVGDKANTTTTVQPGGINSTADNSLTVTPGFTKVFSPTSIVPGGISKLTFTIDNKAFAGDVAKLQLTDTLPTSPAAMLVAPTPNATTTCTGGTLTATAGTATITYAGGTVKASKTCLVSVDVTAPTVGTYTNTSDPLTSDLPGPGQAATATLTVALATVTTLPISSGSTPAAAASLAITGGPKTGLLAGIGFGTLLLGALLVLGSSQRKRLARR